MGNILKLIIFALIGLLAGLLTKIYIKPHLGFLDKPLFTDKNNEVK